MPLPTIHNYNVEKSGVTVGMGTKKVDKTGVYRNKAGHAVYLNEGDQASQAVLDAYEYDGEATKTYAVEPERGAFSSIVDAPQHPEVRKEPVLENRAEALAETRSDAEMAADAAKSKKG